MRSELREGKEVKQSVIETDEPEERIATLVKLTERYCVVFQTLNTRPALSAGVGS